jgi:hypothetical protein
MNWMNISIILGAVAAGATLVEFLHRVIIRPSSSDITIKHQPVRVKEEMAMVTVSHLGLTLTSYVTKDQVAAMEDRIEQRFNAAILDQNRTADERSRRLHKRIDHISNQLNRVIGMMKADGTHFGEEQSEE